MKRVISAEEKAKWSFCANSQGINYKIKGVSSESRGGYIYSNESVASHNADKTKKIEGRFIELYCK